MGQWSYKTHKGSFVKVHYPWHPLYGHEIQVLNTVKRGGECFYTVRLSDASCILLPSWMTDEAYCQRFVLQSEAHCCLESLVQLQAMVESLEP